MTDPQRNESPATTWRWYPLVIALVLAIPLLSHQGLWSQIAELERLEDDDRQGVALITDRLADDGFQQLNEASAADVEQLLATGKPAPLAASWDLPDHDGRGLSGPVTVADRDGVRTVTATSDEQERTVGRDPDGTVLRCDPDCNPSEDPDDADLARHAPPLPAPTTFRANSDHYWLYTAELATQMDTTLQCVVAIPQVDNLGPAASLDVTADGNTSGNAALACVTPDGVAAHAGLLYPPGYPGVTVAGHLTELTPGR